MIHEARGTDFHSEPTVSFHPFGQEGATFTFPQSYAHTAILSSATRSLMADQKIISDQRNIATSLKARPRGGCIV